MEGREEAFDLGAGAFELCREFEGGSEGGGTFVDGETGGGGGDFEEDAAGFAVVD